MRSAVIRCYRRKAFIYFFSRINLVVLILPFFSSIRSRKSLPLPPERIRAYKPYVRI
jgi:hypothetical protein